MIKGLVIKLQEKKYNLTAIALTVLLLEPYYSFKAALQSRLGRREKFHYHGLNQKREGKAILLLHGKFHNQSAWLPLAKNLEKVSNYSLFTVNLPHGAVSPIDHAIVEKKIAEIKDLYGNPNMKIDLVGHSRGGNVAVDFSWQNGVKRKDVGKVTLVGYAIVQEEFDQIKKQDPESSNQLFEILGFKDALVSRKSLLPERQHINIDCGHLALLYDKRALTCIMQKL